MLELQSAFDMLQNAWQKALAQKEQLKEECSQHLEDEVQQKGGSTKATRGTEDQCNIHAEKQKDKAERSDGDLQELLGTQPERQWRVGDWILH